MIYDDRIKALEEKHGVKIEILDSYDVENPRNFGQAQMRRSGAAKNTS